jgi:endo-1,4-beta-xylanase
MYGAVGAREFNMLTTEGEMRWSYTEPSPGAYDFSAGDKLVAYAEQNGMRVRGHNLLWHHLNPKWLETGKFSREELIKLLHDHITAVVTHFRGRVEHWDVVNEPLDGAGGLRDSVWLRGIGPDYLAMAFRWARDADPNAKLFVNEFGIESPGPKLDALVRLVGQLRSQGVPIDGVGFQSHFGLNGPISVTTGKQLRASMTRFRKLRVETAITELDVTVSAQPSPVELDTQAKVYVNALNACLGTATCHTVVVWGFTDAHSWVPSFRPGRGAATLYDAAYNPKPAYTTWTRILLPTASLSSK